MKRTRYSLLIVWVLGIILAGPFLYLYKFRYLPDRTHGVKPYCTTHSPTFEILTLFEDNQLFKRIKHLGNKYFDTSRDFYIFATMMYQFAIPLLYLAFAYGRMSMAMSSPVLGGIESPGTDQINFLAEVFYGANYRSTIITSKNASKNLSFCCFQDKKCIKMPSLFTLLRFFDELFDVITF